MAIPNIFLEATLLTAPSTSLINIEHIQTVTRVPVSSGSDPVTDRALLTMTDGSTMDLLDTYEVVRQWLMP